MSEILFKSQCPAAGCEDDKTYYWYHSECPSWSDEYLSDEANIRCTYCGKSWEFFNSTFQCSARNNEYRRSNLKRVLYCIAALQMANDLTPDFNFKIQQSLKSQWDRYK